MRKGSLEEESEHLLVSHFNYKWRNKKSNFKYNPT